MSKNCTQAGTIAGFCKVRRWFGFAKRVYFEGVFPKSKIREKTPRSMPFNFVNSRKQRIWMLLRLVGGPTQSRSGLWQHALDATMTSGNTEGSAGLRSGVFQTQAPECRIGVRRSNGSVRRSALRTHGLSNSVHRQEKRRCRAAVQDLAEISIGQLVAKRFGLRNATLPLSEARPPNGRTPLLRQGEGQFKDIMRIANAKV